MGKQQKEDGSDVSLNMFVSLLRKGFYLLCALMLFGFSSTNLNLRVSTSGAQAGRNQPWELAHNRLIFGLDV